MRSGEPRESVDGVAALLTRAACGDEAAWRGVVDRYSRRVFAMVRSRCGSDELAEEITQSVFVTLVGQLARGGYTESGRFESWLFRITMNRVRDEVRRAKRQADPIDPGAFDAIRDERKAEWDPELDEETIRLHEAMGRLGEADREVVELRHMGGMGFQAIADLLGTPVGTVLARHHRALRKLKALIEAATKEEGSH